MLAHVHNHVAKKELAERKGNQLGFKDINTILWGLYEIAMKEYSSKLRTVYSEFIQLALQR